MKILFPPDNRKKQLFLILPSSGSGFLLFSEDTQVWHRGGGYDCGGIIMYHVMYVPEKKWVDMVQSRDFFAGKLWANANRSGAS